MKKIAKNTTLLILFSLLVLGIQDLCRKQTKGFALLKAKSSYGSKGPIGLSPEELVPIQSILSQPFHFLTKGLQCYVFVSEDEKYVLKLLKWKELEPPLWVRCLPNSWLTQLKREKKEKKEFDFTSYQIAWDELKEETGLIYLHLQQTEGLDTTLCLYDPIKVRHQVPSDTIEFILQTKAAPFLPYFEQNQNNEEKMVSFFSSFVKILQNRIQKGIGDSDVSLEYNMGVSEDGTPFLFDIGNLSRIEEKKDQPYASLKKESKLALIWLSQNNPKVALFLEKQIQEVSGEIVVQE